MQNVLLTFLGGPLDGEIRQRPIRPEWPVVRFEHPAESEPRLRHVYAGCRVSAVQTDIPMKYLGIRMLKGEPV